MTGPVRAAAARPSRRRRVAVLRCSVSWPHRVTRDLSLAARPTPPAARRRRPGGPRPSARRHGDRPGEPGHRRRVPRSRRPLRHAPVEPRHQSEHRAGGRGLRLRRLLHQRLQPDPPERDGLPVLPGRPDPAHRGRLTTPVTTVARFSHPTGAGLARALPGDAGRTGAHPVSLAVTTRSGISSFTFPAGTAVQRALQGGGQQQPGHGGERPRRGPRRGRGPGVERAVLRHRHRLHAALRRALRPAVHVGRDVGRRRHRSRNRLPARGPPAAPS